MALTKGVFLGAYATTAVILLSLSLWGGIYAVTHEPNRLHWWISVGWFAWEIIRIIYKTTQRLADGDVS